MTPEELSSIIKPVSFSMGCPKACFTRLLTDSRQLVIPADTLFFAISTKRNNGARYIAELYDKGVRNFVVWTGTDSGLRSEIGSLPDANIFFVDDVVLSLQHLASNIRHRFNIPVVGVTGSNGKTIVKDWIVQLLQSDHNMAFNPKSYNSQIGVPLSVWLMHPNNDFAVFEAGISEPGEMQALKNVIEPNIGVFTNIGEAHDTNFVSRKHKIEEKLKLFRDCKTLIYCSDHSDIRSCVLAMDEATRPAIFDWGTSHDCQLRLISVEKGDYSTRLSVELKGSKVFDTVESQFNVEIPFTDRASVENAMQCVALMCFLGYKGQDIASRCRKLSPIAMRLEMNEGVNNCLLINDGYSLDINSLSIALDFIGQVRGFTKKTLIMSDFVQSGLPESELYSSVAELVSRRGISRFVGIGPALSRNKGLFQGLDSSFYSSTADFLQHNGIDQFHGEAILLKGARVFSFENIAKMLQRKTHETIMEVNLDAMMSNANYYRSLIRPSTKLMAMVKASSYGAGKVEVANALQFGHVDYLTVAYADEGVELRRNGITLPIMVMNPEEESFGDIIRFNLEPDIYSFRILNLFRQAAVEAHSSVCTIPVHIEIDTGMHRLGFNVDDMDSLAVNLVEEGCPLVVRSVFSHLACSEDPEMDLFTKNQISRFDMASQRLRDLLPYGNAVLRHILNSSGITRFPEAQFDMVRLGIGLYGISPQPEVQAHLAQVSTLKTRISQIKDIPTGDTVGYNCRWVAQRPSRIAIIPIGYADGLSRSLGHEKGRVEVAGTLVPIIGSVCMDMCFLDVTGVNCSEGDDVILFGSPESLVRMADAAGTIPYEVLTSVSPRVKRVYVSE